LELYFLLIRPAIEGGYWTEVAGLEGCFAQGDTLEELFADARGAIESHLSALQEWGADPPEEFSIASVRLADAVEAGG
jgi:predicted RNase H-like HicB family nuclease